MEQAGFIHLVQYARERFINHFFGDLAAFQGGQHAYGVLTVVMIGPRSKWRNQLQLPWLHLLGQRHSAASTDKNIGSRLLLRLLSLEVRKNTGPISRHLHILSLDDVERVMCCAVVGSDVTLES